MATGCIRGYQLVFLDKLLCMACEIQISDLDLARSVYK
jgi:hypothetical protein